MLISMWMIRDMFGDRVAQVHISEGNMSIRSISLLSQSRVTQKKTAYICPSEQFIPTMKNQVICVHGDDWIVIDSDDFEEVFDYISFHVEEIFDWDQDVRDRIAEGCSLMYVAERATEVLGDLASVSNSLFMMEAHGDYAKSSVPPGFVEELERENMLNIEDTVEFSQDYAHISHQVAAFPYYLRRHKAVGNLCKSLFVEGTFWGVCMFFIGSKSLTQVPRAKQQLFEVYYDQVVFWLSLQNLIGRTETFDRKVSIVLEGSTSMDESRKFFSGIGWDQDSLKHVVLLMLLNDNPSIHGIVDRHFDNLHPKIVHSSRSNVFAIIANSSAITVEALLAGMRPMMHRYSVRVGVSFPIADERQLPEGLRQAQLALRYAERSDEGICYCRDCALEIIRGLLSSESSSCLRHPVISPLAEYDRTHGTDLQKTLRSYLVHERSLVQTARELNVHKNTVKYRIGMIERTFGLDLDDDEQRVHLLVSLALNL